MKNVELIHFNNIIKYKLITIILMHYFMLYLYININIYIYTVIFNYKI